MTNECLGRRFRVANGDVDSIAPRSGCFQRSPGFPTKEGTSGIRMKRMRTLKGCLTIVNCGEAALERNLKLGVLNGNVEKDNLQDEC